MKNIIDIDTLLKPISDSYPSGEDMSFSHEFDEIKEARREDDPTLSQGEWVTELKEADWQKVYDMTTDLLSNATKDIQLLGWLSEALGKLYGSEGILKGLEATTKIIEKFWDDFYPQPEKENLEDREIRLEWYFSLLSSTLETIPLTQNPPFTLLDWKSAKDVDNQMRLDKDKVEKIKKEGKIDSQIFMNAATKTPVTFYEQLLVTLQSANEQSVFLTRLMGKKFSVAPSIKPLRETLDELIKIAEKLCQEKGIVTEVDSQHTNTSKTELPPTETIKEQKSDEKNFPSQESVSSRREALAQLHKLALFFHQTEPHSPVAFLVDRAVKWGNMNLNDWLQEMIKDDKTLFGIQETLGLGNMPYSSVHKTPELNKPSSESAKDKPDKTNESPKPKSDGKFF